MGRLRYALRNLIQAPLVSLVVILSLGLGIGANTAMFSLLRQLILASLPVPHPEELSLVTSPKDFKGGRNSTGDAGGMDFIFSYPMFRGLEKNPAGFQGLAAFRSLGANLAYRNQTVHGQVMVVSGDYFPLLGVRPAVGRVITRNDDVPGAGNAIAILSYGYWRDKLGGEPQALNQPIRINGQTFTIAGVAPEGFNGVTLGQQPEAYVPLSFKPLLTPGWSGVTRYDDFWLYLVGRRKPGVSMLQAETAINISYSGLRDQQVAALKYGPKTKARFLQSKLTLVVGEYGQSALRDESRTPLLILIGATGMVLLIAMANAANLLLARLAQRRHELAIRVALGASRAELMAQSLTEALLLSLGGAITGMFTAVVTLRLLISEVVDGDSPIYFLRTSLDWQVLLYGIGIALLTGLLFGLYPAWDASRSSAAGALKDGSGKSSSTRSASAVRAALVCAQVTVSAVLLIPTGLFLKSLVNLFHIDLGMRTENLVQFTVSPELNGYKFGACGELFERMESELAGIPGVRSVSAAMVPLFAGDNWGNGLKVEGQVANNDNHSYYNEISPGYFGKMGVPLIAGREFTIADNASAPHVAVVNEEFVRKFFDGKSALGKHFGLGPAMDTEIVGIAKNNHYSAVKQEPYPVYYTPWRQDKERGSMSFYLRSALPADQIFPQVRRVMHSLDSSLPTENLRTLDQQISQSIQGDRLVLQLSAGFAVLATALAMLGLYGVMAHSVTRRTREIGIRLALGAAPGRIRVMVMRQMMWILLGGLLVGVPAALWISKFTESQLFGVKSFDAAVLAGAVCALAVAAIAASWIPARRAARVNPTEALRWE